MGTNVPPNELDKGWTYYMLHGEVRGNIYLRSWGIELAGKHSICRPSSTCYSDSGLAGVWLSPRRAPEVKIHTFCQCLFSLPTYAEEVLTK